MARWFGRKSEGLSAWARARHAVRNRIVSGLLVLIPLGITIFILNFLYSMTVAFIEPTVKRLPWQSALPAYAIGILSLCILILILYTVGLVAANMVGRRLIELGEAVLTRIPLVKTIYSVSKQVVVAFAPQGKDSAFRSVALIDFPGKGLRSLVFITGTTVDETGRTCYRVFVPQVPNPTMGFLVIVPAEDVTHTNFTIEEACKALMSGGIIAPERLAGRIIEADAAPEPGAPVAARRTTHPS